LRDHSPFCSQYSINANTPPGERGDFVFRNFDHVQLPVLGLIEEPTKEKVALALDPIVVIEAIQTTTIRDSITAYSTAVGPSSAFRNDTIYLVRFRMAAPKIEGGRTAKP
jgi:hypothetical protein